MTGTNFTYTKDTGEISNRVLHIIQKAPAQNLKALDLTGLSEEDAAKIVNAYNHWLTTVKKPFDAKMKVFTKENLKDFETFLKDEYNILPDAPRVKSFKEHGLKAVEA